MKNYQQSWRSLGEFIRSQRELAALSLRQLAEIAQVSNPYLSQIERGLYRPSAPILKSIAEALHISATSLYRQAGLLDSDHGHSAAMGVEEAIARDAHLTMDQKDALLRVYRGFLESAPAARRASPRSPKPGAATRSAAPRSRGKPAGARSSRSSR
jgi:transcriptional regulator with XRE-family HTH domain